jgi:hypothetical protein
MIRIVPNVSLLSVRQRRARTDELNLAPFDHIEVVLGERALTLLSLAAEVLPIAFDSIPIHDPTPSFRLPLARALERRCRARHPNAGLFRKVLAAPWAGPGATQSAGP